MTASKRQKILVILGPTASGKTALSIELATKHNGEIISADSRQVYKGLDIGTEKVTKKEMDGVPHYLIDVCEPQHIFTVRHFKEMTQGIILDIARRGKLPIIAGGTGFYIDALLYNINLPEVAPDKELRETLGEHNAETLFAMLSEKDPERAETIDPHNKQRLIRALEIVKYMGTVPKLKQKESVYDTLLIGLQTDDALLKKRIAQRLSNAFEKGLVEETLSLHMSGVSWERINEFGLEYRIAGLFAREEISKEEMYKKMLTELWQYAKRQRTWFKRNKDIQWFSLEQKEKIFFEVESFLKKKAAV